MNTRGESNEDDFDTDHPVLSEIHISNVSADMQILSYLFGLLYPGIRKIRFF